MQVIMKVLKTQMIKSTRRTHLASSYVLLSGLLTLILLVTTGCSAILIGKNRRAYDRVLAASEYFKYPSSVRIVSGYMSDENLYCQLEALNSFLNPRSGTYLISTNGYPLEHYSSLALKDGDLNYGAINRALEAHHLKYSSFVTGGILLMSSEVLFITATIYIIINGALASKASDLAEAKMHSKRAYFHLCFWLGLFGYLLVAALPDDKLRMQSEKLIILQERMLKLLEE